MRSNMFTIFGKATIPHFIAMGESESGRRLRREIACDEWTGIAGFPTREQCQAWLDKNQASYAEYDCWTIDADPARCEPEDY